MEDLLVVIGRRLRTARRSIGISQEELASRAEINTSYLSQIERGNREPSLSVLKRLAAAVHLRLQDLFADKETTAGQHERELMRLLASVPKGRRKVLLELLRVGVKLVQS